MDKDTQRLVPVEVATERVKRVLQAATQKGVPDFVINARCDALLQGGTVEEVIQRGRKYLEAGATCVFVWGGGSRGGITREEVEKITKALGGRMSVILKLPEGEGLRVKDLASIGVCRMSVGPRLRKLGLEAVKKEAMRILRST